MLCIKWAFLHRLLQNYPLFYIKATFPVPVPVTRKFLIFFLFLKDFLFRKKKTQVYSGPFFFFLPFVAKHGKASLANAKKKVVASSPCGNWTPLRVALFGLFLLYECLSTPFPPFRTPIISSSLERRRRVCLLSDDFHILAQSLWASFFGEEENFSYFLFSQKKKVELRRRTKIKPSSLLPVALFLQREKKGKWKSLFAFTARDEKRVFPFSLHQVSLVSSLQEFLGFFVRRCCKQRCTRGFNVKTR